MLEAKFGDDPKQLSSEHISVPLKEIFQQSLFAQNHFHFSSSNFDPSRPVHFRKLY